MKDKIYDLFVAYKTKYDGNRPSFGYISGILGLSRSAVKYHIDADDRFEWIEIVPGTRELCLKGGAWSLRSHVPDIPAKDTGLKS